MPTQHSSPTEALPSLKTTRFPRRYPFGWWAVLSCLFGAFGLFGLGAASRAWAQVPPEAGIAAPWGSVADTDQPSAIRLNPAALGFQSAWGVRLTHIDQGQPFVGERGDGEALFASFKPLSMLGLGVGIQYLWPYQDNGAQVGGMARISFAGALRLAPWVGLGLNLHGYLGRSPEVQSLFSLDLGLIFRPWNFLSVGVHVRDLNAPALGGALLSRIWDVGLAIRPLLNDRWTLSADLSVSEDLLRQPLLFRYRTEFEALDGLVLGVSLQHGLDLRTLEIGGFLAFRFGHGGLDLFGSGRLRTDGGAGSGFGAYSASAWVSGAKHRPIFQDAGIMPLLDISGPLPERDLRLSLRAGEPSFLKLLLALQRVEQDPRVTGLLLRIGALSCGYAKLQEIRAILERIRKKNKRIVVYITGGDLKGYYLASAADRVFLHPAGSLLLGGLATSHLFFAQALKRIGVQPQFIKVGAYKTAPNRFTESQLTPPHREANKLLLDDLFSQILADVTRTRKITLPQFQSSFQTGLFTAKEAKDLGLIDDFFFWEQIDEKIAQSTGRAFRFAPDYFTAKPQPERWLGFDQIAVLHVDGTIVSGVDVHDPIFGVTLSGTNTLISALRKARSDGRIKAVVLRINSPGGEVLASDLIWREVAMLDRIKPVVVSMGDVAASGGYYIAAAAREIFASPATVTGSIGIFAGKFDFSGLLQKIGVQITFQQRGEMASLFSPLQPFSPNQQKQMQRYIQLRYDQFIDRIVQGRKLTATAVRAVGEGRVWSGQRALQHKLVNHLGGLLDAIERARSLADLSPDTRIEYLSLPGRPDWQVSLSNLPGLSSLLASQQLAQTLQQLRLLASRFQSLHLWALSPYTSP